MTTDVFIAGLIGMVVIAVAVAVLSVVFGPCGNQDRKRVGSSSLPK